MKTLALLTFVTLVVLCNSATIRILTWDGQPVILRGLQDGIAAFMAANPGYPHTFVAEGIANTAELYRKVVADLAKPYGSRSWDSYLVTLGWIADIAGQAEDLTPRIMADAGINWADIPPFFQQVSSLDGKVYSIILDGDQHLVYYRRSLLNAAGFSAPKTWEDYIAIAKYFNGKDLNGDGVPDFGSCFTKTQGGIAYNMFFSMLAAETQSQGTHQGVFFNPEDMTGNFDTPAGRQALYNWWRTHQYGPSIEDEAYGLTQQRINFLGGRCALSIDWGDTGAYSFVGTPYIRGDLGTSALPGSDFVLHDGERRQCTDSICPYSMDGTNRTPFGANGGGHGGFIAKDAPQAVRDALYALYRYMSTHSNGDMIRGDDGFDPYRYSHLVNSLYTSAGMNPTDASLYVGAFAASLNNPNFGLDLRIPNTALYQAAVDEGLRRLIQSPSATVDSVAAFIQAEVEAITDAAGRQSQLNALRLNLGLPPKTLPTPENPCDACPHHCPPCPPAPPTCPNNGCGCGSGSGTNINFDFGHMIA